MKPDHQAPTYNYEFFICHASEDKDDVARPLADALTARGYSVWLDERVLTVGDSLRQSIERGLRISRYGVVVVSPALLSKRWPQLELNGFFALEQQRGKTILPVWHGVNSDQVVQAFPILSDRVAAQTHEGIHAVADALLRATAETALPMTPTPSVPAPSPNWAEALNHYSKAFGGVETFLFIGNTFARESRASIDEFRTAVRDQRLILNDFLGGWPWAYPPFPERREPEWRHDRCIFAMDRGRFWYVWRNGFAFCTTDLCWEEGRAQSVGIGTVAQHLLKDLAYARRLASALSLVGSGGSVDARIYSVKDWSLVREGTPSFGMSPKCSEQGATARTPFEYQWQGSVDAAAALLCGLAEVFCHADGRTALRDVDLRQAIRDQAHCIPPEDLTESPAT